MSDEVKIPEVFGEEAEIARLQDEIRSAPRRRREKIEDLVAKHGSSWGPRRIAEFLWKHHRDLIPSDTFEQAENLVSKDLSRMFRDIDDAETALQKGRMAAQILKKRLERLLIRALEDSEDENLSEPMRASKAKLAHALAIDLAKLDGFDIAKTESKKTPKRWQVEVGTGGVAAAKPAEDDDQLSN